MDISQLSQYLNIIIVGICLCVGYVIKTSITFIPNKYIPLIMLILGTGVSIFMNLDRITAPIILKGMVSGLASTGFHEAFKNMICKVGEDDGKNNVS